MLISIIIPIYNEKETLPEIIDLVNANKNLTKEVIIIDDYSVDGTRELIKNDISQKVSKVIYHEKNLGKGAAIRSGLTASSGEIIIIQDADLEYNPDDYPALLKPIMEGKADVVFGSRFQGGTHRVLYFWHSLGNKFLTALSNMFTNLNLTDMETGYKVFTKKVKDSLSFECNRFGFEPEFTAKVARKKFRIYEVPISYYGRDYSQGKKITWKDGIAAIYFILKFALFKR
tara:strand:+ start:181 stop:870 length:690 start_codon:yes stop_codon:yes gene_type:complete